MDKERIYLKKDSKVSSLTSSKPTISQKLIKGDSAEDEFTNNKSENDVDSFEEKITSILSKKISEKIQFLRVNPF